MINLTLTSPIREICVLVYINLVRWFRGGQVYISSLNGIIYSLASEGHEEHEGTRRQDMIIRQDIIRQDLIMKKASGIVHQSSEILDKSLTLVHIPDLIQFHEQLITLRETQLIYSY